MGRPSKNNADYFPHFTTMRHHRKIKVLRNKFGSVLGYAFWCMMLEWIGEHDGLEWEYSELECEMFAADLGVSAAEIRSMVDFCISIELLFKTESNFIFSESLNENLQSVFEKRAREKEKSKARKRRESGQFESSNATKTQEENKNTTSGGVSAAEMPQSKVEESKANNTPLTPQIGGAPPEPPKGEVLTEKERKFLELFNLTCSRKCETLPDKAKRQLKKLIKKGFTTKQFITSLTNGFADSQKWEDPYKYTPEYATRDTVFEKYLYANDSPGKQKGVPVNVSTSPEEMDDLFTKKQKVYTVNGKH